MMDEVNGNWYGASESVRKVMTLIDSFLGLDRIGLV